MYNKKLKFLFVGIFVYSLFVNINCSWKNIKPISYETVNPPQDENLNNSKTDTTEVQVSIKQDSDLQQVQIPQQDSIYQQISINAESKNDNYVDSTYKEVETVELTSPSEVVVSIRDSVVIGSSNVQVQGVSETVKKNNNRYQNGNIAEFRKPETKKIEKVESEIKPNFRVIKNAAFSTGEKLTFAIKYGFIRAGIAVMSINSIQKINGIDCYYITSEAYSNKTFSWVYKVEDKVESYVHKTGFFSVKFRKRLREGSYKFDGSVDYDTEKLKASIERIRLDKNKEPERYIIDVPPFTQDILSAFYFVRTQKLEVGKEIYMDNHDNGKKIYKLKVVVHKKERIEVPAGIFDCVVVEPLLQDVGLFKSEGKVMIWMTDDERKIPVLMKTKVLVGHIDAELESIEGINGEIKAMVKK
jgi:hypothetical protein